MTRSPVIFWAAAWCTAVLHASPAMAQIGSFEDIQYWVGEGANQAVLVIDWSEVTGEGSPLAWGYRWDGAATGRQMLLDVVAADERLFGKFSADEQLLFGLGYDRHEPASFAVSDGSDFDERGIAYSSTNLVGDASATDPSDAYAEGWDDYFWHYGIRSGEFASPWSSSQQGMGSRALADGAIDGWTFAEESNFEAFPDPATAALPPAFPQPGDFNADGVVDAADYTVWRDAAADPDDYLVWRNAYAMPAASAANTSFPAAAAPEPHAALLMLVGGGCLAGLSRFSHPHLGMTS